MPTIVRNTSIGECCIVWQNNIFSLVCSRSWGSRVLVRSKQELDSIVALVRNMVLVGSIAVQVGNTLVPVDSKLALAGSIQVLGSIRVLGSIVVPVRSRRACSDCDRKYRRQKLQVPMRKRQIQGKERFVAWMGLR